MPTSPLHSTLGSWRFRVPRADPEVFMPWIRAELERRGVLFESRRVTSLADEASRCDAVVNCTGLGARLLTDDPDLRGIRGDLCVAEPSAWGLARAAADEATGHTYVIPRRDTIVIGGTSVDTELAGVLAGDPATAERLHADAIRVGVAAGARLGAIAGVRPYRTEVRLQRDPVLPNVVHNYGHGGSGWTLCHGCAQEVATLVAQAVANA
jgi:D-amino-acid oxidase